MQKNVPMKSLLDVFPDWAEGDGIFSEMSGVPWDDEVSEDLLDLDYFGNYSGWKKCSPLVYKLLDTDYQLSDANRKKLADLVTAKFLPNWVALWNSFHFEYDPINDYDITELGEREGTRESSRQTDREGTRDDTTTLTTTHGHTVSEVGSTEIDEDTSLTHGEVIEDTSESDVTEQNSRYGFNSATASPADDRTGSSEATRSTTHSGTDGSTTDTALDETKTTTHGGSDTSSTVLDSDDTLSESVTDSGTETDEYTKQISGVRGNYSRQELIKKERELWRRSYFDQVYSDVDSVLTSLIYKREHWISPYSVLPFGYYSI